jgi:hypothetical protein
MHEEPTMPYLRLDLAKTYPSQTKRELAVRLCHLYADVMQTQSWRPNMGIAELGGDNLFHLGEGGLESIRGHLCRVLGVPKRTVLVEFTAHSGDEILRDGEWAGEWTAAEASSLPSHTGERS